jgi:hypothetical protein
MEIWQKIIFISRQKHLKKGDLAENNFYFPPKVLRKRRFGGK